MRFRLSLVCVVALMAAAAPLDGNIGQPDAGGPATEWVQIHPGEDTECAFGTPFSFFFREGADRSTLVVYFEGGGACWEWVSCSGMFDTNVADDELSEFRGIFDFANPANPFRRHPIVFIPYCTGDVHLGDTLAHYGDRAATQPVAHRGSRNVEAVLRWLSGRIQDGPTNVVVTGTSAGSYGALFHAPRIAELFPSARVKLIGDSGVPLLKDYPAVLASWGAARTIGRIRDTGPLRSSQLTLEAAHEHFAGLPSAALLAHITSDRDAVQSAFYLISGSHRAREATYSLLDSLQATTPTFRTFVVAGTDHGLLVTDRLYSYSAGGVRLIDWLDDAISGQEVVSHRCEECRLPEP